MPVSLHLIRVPWRYPLPQARRVAGAAALVLADGVTPLRPEPALFESMLEGWGPQQRSRRLSVPLIQGRERAGAPVPGVHRRVALVLDA
jgi:hypothetical protein